MADAFEAYDFEADERWREYRAKLLVPPGPRAEAVLRKKQVRWFKANVDESYEPPAAAASPPPPPPVSEEPKAAPKPQAAPEAPRAAPSPAAPAAAPKLGIALSYAQLAGHALALLLAVCSVVPFVSPVSPFLAFKLMLQLACAVQLVAVFRTYGRPQWSKDYAQRLALDEETHFAAYALLLLTHPVPSVLGAAPIAARAALFVARSAESILGAFYPAQAARLRPTLARVTGQAAQIYAFAATMEIYAALAAVVQALVGSGSFLLAIMFWQYLRVRYVLSHNSRAAFGALRAQLDGLFAHPACPGALRGAWQKVCSALHSMVDPAQQSARPSCAIM